MMARLVGVLEGWVRFPAGPVGVMSLRGGWSGDDALTRHSQLRRWQGPSRQRVRHVSGQGGRGFDLAAFIFAHHGGQDLRIQND